MDSASEALQRIASDWSCKEPVVLSYYSKCLRVYYIVHGITIKKNSFTIENYFFILLTRYCRVASPSQRIRQFLSCDRLNWHCTPWVVLLIKINS